MDSYVVRIYRRGEADSSEIVGVVEEVESQERRAFKTIDELWAILLRSSPPELAKPRKSS